MFNCLGRGGGKKPLFILLFANFLALSSCTSSNKQLEEAADEVSGEEGNQNLTNDDNKAAIEVGASTVQGNYVGGSAGVPMGDGLPELGTKMAYIVVKGDSLSKIAKRMYSNYKKWPELAKASAIKHPNLIYPGDVVYYQLDATTLAFARKYEAMKREETVAKDGESLFEISKRVFGSEDEWKVLWRYNDHINNPTALKAGEHVYYVSHNTTVSGSVPQVAKLDTKAPLKGVMTAMKAVKTLRTS